MPTSVTPSELRQDVYRLIDQVLESGEPLEIRRNGRTLRLVPEASTDRLGRIHVNPAVIVGDPEDLVTGGWAAEWDDERALHP